MGYQQLDPVVDLHDPLVDVDIQLPAHKLVWRLVVGAVKRNERVSRNSALRYPHKLEWFSRKLQ